MATDSGNAQTVSAGVTVSIASTATLLPAPWTSTDIGNVGVAGSASYSNGVFTVRGAGLDIWGSADAFHFASHSMTGDGQIVARIASIQNTNIYAKAGVMLRSALTANAAHVILDVKPGGGLEFMIRSATGGSTTFLAAATAGVPVWLKLARAGATVIASWSTNGAVWTEVGRTTTALPTTVFAGLPVTSHTTSGLNTATVDNVSVTSGPVNHAPTVAITAPTPGATFLAPASVPIAATATDADGTINSVEFFANGATIGTDTTGPYGLTWTPTSLGSYTLTAVATDSGNAQTVSAGVTVSIASTATLLPAPWAHADIGNVGLAGSATYSNGVFTVKGAGADIWNSADAFHYVYQPFTGDGQITLRVTSLQNTHPYAKAGVMLRGALTANAAHVMLNVRPAGGLEFLTRSGTGEATTLLASATAAVPVWLKLARAGATVIASWSTNGAVWTEVGRITTALPTTVFAGLPVTSHTTSGLNTATVDNVSVTSGPVNHAPTVAITAPTPGATFLAPASVPIAATATDADGTISSVEFFANGAAIGTDTISPYGLTWTPASLGSYTLAAVATDSGNAQTMSAGVTISVASTASPLPAPWAQRRHRERRPRGQRDVFEWRLHGEGSRRRHLGQHRWVPLRLPAVHGRRPNHAPRHQPAEHAYVREGRCDVPPVPRGQFGPRHARGAAQRRGRVRQPRGHERKHDLPGGPGGAAARLAEADSARQLVRELHVCRWITLDATGLGGRAAHTDGVCRCAGSEPRNVSADHRHAG